MHIAVRHLLCAELATILAVLTGCGGALLTNSTPIANPNSPIGGNNSGTGGSSGTGTGTGGSAPTPITITASGVSIPAGGTLQFTANGLVTWQVNGLEGGNSSVGSITNSGLYTAPGAALISSPLTVSITAVPTTGIATSGSISITVTPPVISISPTTVSLSANQTQLFKASISNSTETAIVWAVNGILGGNGFVGTIGANGLYTAPSQVSATVDVRVTALLAANGNIAASATVTVSP